MRVFSWLGKFFRRVEMPAFDISPAPYLERFAKKLNPPAKFIPGETELQLVQQSPFSLADCGLCLMDAFHHLILFYRIEDGSIRGLANIGFNINRLTGTVYIRQIQAARFESLRVRFGRLARLTPEERARHQERAVTILKSLRWEKMLVQLVCDWAAKNGFRKAKILKAEHNPWRGKRLNIADIEHNERLKMHYDVTAERMGFKASRWSPRYWVKRLA